MKLTVTVRLRPTPEQAATLRATVERANAACDHISAVAWETHTFGQFALQKATYHDVKATFGLTAQLVVRCVSKVTDAYKLDKRRRRTFRPLGAIAYDDRILRWQAGRVSIWTTDGRAWIPFRCDDRTRALLAHRQGESDLLYRDGCS
jgi:putative transposase